MRNPALRLFVVMLLRGALVGALALAGWRLYRQLPVDDSGANAAASARAARPTMLHIVMRSAGGNGDEETAAQTVGVPVQLYAVDVAAAQREFISERRPGMRFEDFVARRAQGRTSISTRLDREGRATIAVPPGRWWIYATLDGAQDIHWRLPVNVAGREQTAELTPDNAYARSKSF